VTVYGAKWCPDCRALKKVLARNLVPYDWRDVDTDAAALAKATGADDGRSRIPTVELVTGELLAEPSAQELLERLGVAAADARPFYDVVIVGGGPTGLTAAIYTARESLDTLILERAGVGGQAGITETLENFPGFDEGISGVDFVARLQRQAERFGAEITQGEEVSGVRAEGQFLVVTTVNRREIVARAVLIATGSKYSSLGVPGEQQLMGTQVHFCATCDGPRYQGKEVMVIGAGDSGFEEALHLTKFATDVTIVGRSAEIKASRILQDKVSEKAKMHVLTNRGVKAFRVDAGKLGAVEVEDNATGQIETYSPDGVFVFIGLRPNSGFLPDAVARDAQGFIVTESNLATSMPGVFAAGDVRVGSTKQAVAAAGDGTTAAIMIRHYLQSIGEARANDAIEAEDV
jgi:thioredoxin reductase (NADPH)